MNKRILSVSFLAAFLLCLCTASVVAAFKSPAIINKYFNLYTAKKNNPYTLYYPINIDRPGEVVVSVKVKQLTPEPRNDKYEPLRVVLIDSRAFKNIQPAQWKRWLNKANKFNPAEYIAGDKIRRWVKGVKRLFGKKEKKPSYYHGQMKCGKVMEGRTEIIKHAIDAPELNKTGGKYVVVFRNLSTYKAEGSIFISYPGSKSELDLDAEKMFECYPDLTVEEVGLNNKKQLFAKIANRSRCGGVHIARWNQKGPEAITLLANVNGRNYGVTLPSVDKNKNLMRPNSSITHVFDKVVISKSTKVTVTVDGSRKVMENDERNNSKTVQLGPVVASLKPVTPVAKPGRRTRLKPAMKPLKKPAVMPGLVKIAAKPDLTVNAVYLNSSKNIIVEISNIGTSGLDPSNWAGENRPYLQLKMNGNGWSNTYLNLLDENKKLAQKDSRVVYNTGYVLKEKATIIAVIDPLNSLKEVSESNNSMQSVLLP